MAELPLHPAVIHFPIAGAFFAAGALALALWKPAHRAAALAGAVLLLAATVAGGLAAAVTGWHWADELAYLAGGWGPIPGPRAVAGLAQRHALLALASIAVAALALGLALLARKRDASPLAAFLAALLACALMAATGHIGGTMVHAPPEPAEDRARIDAPKESRSATSRSFLEVPRARSGSTVSSGPHSG